MPVNTTKSGLKKIHSALVKAINADGILSFTETPAEEKASPGSAPVKDRLYAADLFSLFTADIIKKDVPFTR